MPRRLVGDDRFGMRAHPIDEAAVGKIEQSGPAQMRHQYVDHPVKRGPVAL